MRYNPPPGWPAAPEGWQPPPGWAPDPSWPPAPEGWQLWVADDAPAFGHEGEERSAATRGPAVKQFWIGVALFLVAAIVTYVSSGGGGGVLWYGGMIFGALMLFRAFQAYRASRAAGGPPLGGLGKAATGVALAACLGVGALAATSAVEASSLKPELGSCWKLDGDEAVLVGCSRAHDYEAVGVVQDEAQCPETSIGWVEGDGTDLVCLGED